MMRSWEHAGELGGAFHSVAKSAPENTESRLSCQVIERLRPKLDLLAAKSPKIKNGNW